MRLIDLDSGWTGAGAGAFHGMLTVDAGAGVAATRSLVQVGGNEQRGRGCGGVLKVLVCPMSDTPMSESGVVAESKSLPVGLNSARLGAWLLLLLVLPKPDVTFFGEAVNKRVATTLRKDFAKVSRAGRLPAEAARTLVHTLDML